MGTIPFKIPIGFEYNGLLRFEQPFVVLEFGKWSWRKMSKQIIQVSIPISEIVSVDFNSSLLETRLDLQLRSMKIAEEIPSSKPGLIQLQFTKRDREAARALVAHLSAAVAEQRLEQLEGELRRLEE